MTEPVHQPDNQETVLEECRHETRRRDWKRRLNAAKQLGDMGPVAKPAVQDLVILLHDTNENVVGTALIAISKIQPTTKNIIQPLIKLVLSKSESLAKMANHTISKLVLVNRHLIPALITALDETPLFDRCKIITALGHIGPHANDAVPPLFKIVQQELSEDFAFSYALDAIEEIGLPKKDALDNLYELLKDGTGRLRLFSLPDYDENNTIILNHVLPIFEESIDKYYYLHYQMITLITSSHIGPETFIQPLIQCLAHPDKTVRRYSAECFAYIGPPAYDAVPALVWALKDKHHEVRYFSAEALGYIGATAYHAIPALTEAIHDENPTVRESAKEAIDKIHTRTIN